ncbi:MAG: hypothetical protein AABY18_04770 [Candidatus Thermoplasmatota archaeon]
MVFSIEQELSNKLMAVFGKAGAQSSEMAVVIADRHLASRNLITIEPLEEGPSMQIALFDARHCRNRHGDAPHNVLECIKQAYYERLARDQTKLAAMAASRTGEYGTAASYNSQDSSPRWTALSSVPLPTEGFSLEADRTGVVVAPPASGPQANASTEADSLEATA